MLRQVGIRAERRSFLMAKQRRNPPLTESEMLSQTIADLQEQMKQLTTFINNNVLQKAAPLIVKIDKEKTDSDDTDDDKDDDLEENVEFFSGQIVNPRCSLFEEDEFKGNEYSFVDQIGDPIFDVFDEYDKKENAEYLSEQIIDPSYEVCDEDVFKGNKDYLSNQISDPIFNVIDKDEPELLGVERAIDAVVFYDNPIYDADTTMPSQQTYFGEHMFAGKFWGK